MRFHDTELRHTYPDLFRNDDLERRLAAARLALRPGDQTAALLRRWIVLRWAALLRPKSRSALARKRRKT